MTDYFSAKITSHDLRIFKPLKIPKMKTTNDGIKSLRVQGPKIWNSFPAEIKSARNTKQFKH